MLRELMQEMFSQMVEAKDISQVEKYYDPISCSAPTGRPRITLPSTLVMRGYIRPGSATPSSTTARLGSRAGTGSAGGCGLPRNARGGRDPYRGDLPGRLPARAHPSVVGADLAPLVTAEGIRNLQLTA